MCLSSSDTSDMESDEHSDVTAPRYSPFTTDGGLLSSASEGENEEPELESEINNFNLLTKLLLFLHSYACLIVIALPLQ